MNRNIRILFGLALLSFIAACSSSRNMPFESFSLEPETEKTLMQKIVKTENANVLTQISRFSAEYSGMQEQNNFKGFVRIAQDSLLMMSLSPAMGTEAMRFLLSPDTALTLNRLDFTYSRKSYSASNQMIPLPYELLEALLSYHFTTVLDDDFSLKIQDRMYLLEGEKNKQNYVAYAVDANYLVRKFYYKDFQSNTSVNVLYNSFLDLDGQKFPESIEVSIQNQSDMVLLRLTVKKVDFKDELSFPFSISSKYTRVF